MKLLTPLLVTLPLCSFAAPLQTHDAEQNIVELADSAGSFKTLLAAASAAGLDQALSGEGPFTVFAPTDEAFAKLPKQALEALLLPENKSKLVEVLSQHVVSGRVQAADAISAKQADALAGGKLKFSIVGGRMEVNGATVLVNDLAATNGVVHVIDTVLAPPSGLAVQPKGRLVIGVYTDLPSRALCEQLGLERNKTLLITRVTNGTAKEAGLQKYDLLLSIAGQPATEKQLRAAKKQAQFGGVLDLEFLRQGKRMSAHVKVGIERH